MTRYLISFPGDAMVHIPDEAGPEVARAAHAVIDEAKAAGVYLFAGGLDEDVEPVMVAGDGTVTADTYPQTKEQWGGVTVIDVPTREAALEWAAKIAAACRCPQEVREFMFDPLI
ncbi:MAG: YciI family protein [Trebonia sp.]